MYLAIGRALDISVSQLGTLSMWRALVQVRQNHTLPWMTSTVRCGDAAACGAQAICIPFVGIAGNMINRIWLIAAGTVLWGSMSAGLGFSANYAEVLPASA